MIYRAAGVNALTILISLWLLYNATARPGCLFHPTQTLILFKSNANPNSNSITFLYTQSRHFNTHPNYHITRNDITGPLNSDPLSFDHIFGHNILQADRARVEWIQTKFHKQNYHDLEESLILKENKLNDPEGPSDLDFSLFGLHSSVSASFRDRTKDILRVVGSLLFGLGCGALTAATLFLVWSLFVPDRFRSVDEESEDDYTDFEDSPKKAGYVKIMDPVKEVV